MNRLLLTLLNSIVVEGWGVVFIHALAIMVNSFKGWVHSKEGMKRGECVDWDIGIGDSVGVEFDWEYRGEGRG